MNFLMKVLCMCFLTIMIFSDATDISNRIKKRNFPPLQSLEINVLSNGDFSLTGGIGVGDCEKFKTIINVNKNPNFKTLYLNSPGGVTTEGMCIADEVRNHNMNTVVTGESIFIKSNEARTSYNDASNILLYKASKKTICNSACTYIFMNGRTRKLEGNVMFGIHSPGLVSDVIFSIDPRIAEFTGFRNGYNLSKEIKKWKIPNTEIEELFFAIPNRNLWVLTPKEIKENPKYKDIATVYKNFWGYSDPVKVNE